MPLSHMTLSQQEDNPKPASWKGETHKATWVARVSTLLRSMDGYNISTRLRQPAEQWSEARRASTTLIRK